MHQLLRGQERERTLLVAAQRWWHRTARAEHRGRDLCPRLHHQGSLVLAAHQHTSVPREGAGKAPGCQLRTLLPSACVPWTLDHGGEQACSRGQCSTQINPTLHQLVLSREVADHAGFLRHGAHDMGLRSLVLVAAGHSSCPGPAEERPGLSLQLCTPSLQGTAGCRAAALPVRAASRLQHHQSHWGQTQACSPQHTASPQYSLGRPAAQCIWGGAKVKSLCTGLADGKASCRLTALP